MSDRIDQIKNPRRIVVKIGTNVLIDDSGQLDLELIENLVSDIASVHQQGIEVVIVTSGAIAFGANMLGIDMENQDVRSKQALAAVGQSRLMHAYEQIFETHNIVVAQALISRSDITDREGYLNVRNTLVTLMDFNTVPIINENDVVALEEIGVKVFGDNDNLSSMVSNLIDADLLILLSDIDGLHTMDPHRHPDAELVLEVDTIDESIEAMAGISHSSRIKGGMQAKLDAIKLATASGIAVVLVNGRNPSVVSAVLAGKNVGTFFKSSSTKMESRKRWMLSGLSNACKIVVDFGAANALLQGKSSLLPAGISEVVGVCKRGDIISIENMNGKHIACGITGYDSEDISVMKGLHSDDILKILGYYYGEEIIHRNNMVLL